jgi:predicted ester cyclase
MSASTAATRAVIGEYIRRVWIERDLAALSDYLAPDEQFRAETRGHLEQLFGAFSDVSITVHQILVDGEDAAVRATISGRHTGQFAAIAPTGRKVQYDTIRIFHFLDGRIVATEAIQDRLGLLQQLGAVGGPSGVNWAGTASAKR